MRVSDEPNVALLRQKAKLLERENERLSEKVSELLREILALKGMLPSAFELNLPGLVAQAAGAATTTTTPKSERLPKTNTASAKKGEKQSGHGPTEQPELAIKEESFKVDDPDRLYGVCGKGLTPCWRPWRSA